MKKTFWLFTIVFFLLESVFYANAQVLNPVQGTWANKQVLVVDSPSSSSVYYSLSGEDPESSGIAYDGPVLIDLDGDVSVSVAVIDKSGNKQLQKIDYKVSTASLPDDEDACKFVETINLSGAIDYNCGDVFSIPSSLEFSFGTEDFEFEPGTEISVSKNSVVPRMLPCTVTDGKSKWRFVINVHPVATGLYTRKDVPFEISDWSDINFKDRKKIYKIDDGWWNLPKETLQLDRSQKHMISWQDVAYSEENIVKFYVLPPKPLLRTEKLEDGALSVSFEGQEGYKFGILDSDGNSSELFDQLTIDTFKGDCFKGTLEAGIYFDSVFQGKFEIPFAINKKMPAQPVISSSVPGNFIRENTLLTINSPENNKIFVNFSGPVVLNDDYSIESNSTLFELSDKEFEPLEKKSFTLSSSADGATAYRVLAYCVDAEGNKSKTVEYSVIIDTCNYYIDGSADSEENKKKANGSKDAPYSSFSEIVPFLKNSRFLRINVKGNVSVPDERIVINSNCSLQGSQDARLILGSKTNFDIRNSSFSFSDVLISVTEQDFSRETANIFNVERGVLFFSNVEMNCLFGKNGTAINSDNSVINVENSGITVSASVYSCVVSAVQSKLNIKKSRISTVADTAVNFSAQGGLFELKDSECKVTASLGRIAELFDTYSTITGNDFSGDLKNRSGNGVAVYMDKKNHSVEYLDNLEAGF